MCLLLLSIMLSFSPPHPSVIHALATYDFSHLSQYPHLPEPPPNSQHAPVLRNPPRPTATPPRRGAEHIPSRERNPPRPTATPPRRGAAHIPSREGCRVSGGVGCPQPGPLRQAQDHPLRLGSGQASNLMQGSNLGFRVWALAFYLLSTGIKGTLSMKLHRDLGITQKSAALVST